MQVSSTYFLAQLNVLGIFYLCLSAIVFLRLFPGLYAFISDYSHQGFSLNHDNLKWSPYLLAHKLNFLAFVFSKRFWILLFCRVTRGNSGRGVIPVIEQYFFQKIFKGELR